jgi:hypothetical protein
MADLSTKKDPLHLREEKPDYVQDQSGTDDPEGQPDIGTDPMDLPVEGARKPTVHLDEEKVRRAEEKGEGL